MTDPLQTVLDDVYTRAAAATGKTPDQLRAMAVQVFASMLQRALDRPDELVWSVIVINRDAPFRPELADRYISPGGFYVEVDLPRRKHIAGEVHP